MKPIEFRLPKEFDKSFIVFKEIGQYFPCPWHYHPEFEIVLVTKSSGRRIVGDHVGYYEEGDLVIMGSLLPHVWESDAVFVKGESEFQAEAIVIQFLENFLGDTFMAIPEVEKFKSVLSLSERGILVKGNARAQINDIMVTMPQINGLQRLSALFSIFDILSRTSEYELLASPGFIQNFQFKCSHRFQKVTEYIMMNFDEDIELDTIAGVANMAVTTFCNFFKAQYRMTFVEFLKNVRIGHACKLLSEQQHTIVEIAYMCGFKNISNFNRQFRSLKNMTPTDYRKMMNEETEYRA